jgi:RNA polymerase sigma-70 factor (ECF subfamily)
MAQEGQAPAFDALVRRYSERVFRVAYRMLAQREDAEDVRQEAFLDAYRHLRAFRGDAAFGTWMYSITARLCLGRRRREKRRTAGAEMLVLEEERLAGSDGRMLANDEGLLVQRALRQLPAKERLLLVLKLVEGLSHEEIAQVLHCSVENSRTRLRRAKERFRECYRKEVDGGGL